MIRCFLDKNAATPGGRKPVIPQHQAKVKSLTTRLAGIRRENGLKGTDAYAVFCLARHNSHATTSLCPSKDHGSTHKSFLYSQGQSLYTTVAEKWPLHDCIPRHQCSGQVWPESRAEGHEIVLQLSLRSWTVYMGLYRGIYHEVTRARHVINRLYCERTKESTKRNRRDPRHFKHVQ